MSSPPPDISCIFPADVDLTASVRDWADRVIELGHRVDRCGVVGVTYGKCRGGRKEHEFLIIRIRHLNEDGTFSDNYLVVERGPELQVEGQSSGIDDVAQGSKVLSSQSVPAKDQVTISKDGTYHTIVKPQGTYRNIAEMHFENPVAFKIAQLAVLFKVVNRHAPEYHIIQHQCFWFAYSIWAIMAKAASCINQSSNWDNCRGVYQRKLVLPEIDTSDIEAEFAVAWQTAQGQAQEQAARQAAHDNQQREEGREQGKRERDADIEQLTQERERLKQEREQLKQEREQLKQERDERAAEVERLKQERDADLERLKQERDADLERLRQERDSEVLCLEHLLLKRDGNLQASGRSMEFDQTVLSL